MYQKDQYVMHKSEGVCLVEDIRTERFAASPREYYILRPAYGHTATTVYLPLESGQTRLRSLSIADDLAAALSADDVWPWEDNDRVRQESLRTLVGEAQVDSLCRFLRAVYRKRNGLAGQGKRLRYADEQFLQDAERLLSQEVAHVMQMEPTEALAHIRETLR